MSGRTWLCDCTLLSSLWVYVATGMGMKAGLFLVDKTARRYVSSHPGPRIARCSPSLKGPCRTQEARYSRCYSREDYAPLSWRSPSHAFTHQRSRAMAQRTWRLGTPLAGSCRLRNNYARVLYRIVLYTHCVNQEVSIDHYNSLIEQSTEK